MKNNQSKNSKLPNTTTSHVTRRDFLKISKITTISILASSFSPFLSHPTRLLNTQWVEDSEPLLQALGIATKAPLFQETVFELQSLGFQITPDPAFVTIVSLHDDYVGVVISHNNPTSPRTGADLVLTIDLFQKEIMAVEYLIGWCLVDSLELFRVFFDGRLPLYEELRDERLVYDIPPRMLRPRNEQNLSYWRPDSPPIRPEDLVLDGWPVEMLDWTYWHYNGCINAGWRAENDTLFYMCTQISELRSSGSKEIRVIDL